ASNEELAQTMGGLRGLRIGMLEGNTDEGYIALGTGIGNIRSIIDANRPVVRPCRRAGETGGGSG
ncbi:hypothetical protein MJM25_28940, partial [Salmonella enterica subsp. enterica serovar Lubbock]|nr:hypothetical protein [Salmonella enterica subsp. enterica serovar Lubbock]